MSFYLYRSNRLETLAGLFQKHLYETRKDVFAPVPAVVANGGMGAFLQRYIAGHSGIAANLQFGFLRDFLTQSICCFLSEEEQEQWRKSQENFSTSVLSWRIGKLLTERESDFPQWGSYFASGNVEERERRRFELSSKLAKLFDDYSLYCHEKLILWNQGELAKHPFDGQQKLYCALTSDGNIPGREYFFDRFLKAEVPQFPERLPQAAGIFGIASMPELYLKILVKLSKFCDIHFFCPSPSKEFMEVDRRTCKEKLEDALNETPLDGHPLLTDLGKTGADFLNTLLENDCMTGLAGEEEESFSPALPEGESKSCLQQFQSDLLNQFYRKGDDKISFPVEDDSVMLHSCHTVRRELEVLHDKLVNLFKSGRYTPDDVIVMFPDIDRYAPVIEAVFSSGPFAGAYSVCDRKQLESSSAVVCFLRLLKLCDSRFTAPEIMELLEFPFLMSRFRFDYSDLPELEKIILESSIHWGFDAGLHNRFCGVNFPEYSFQDGFDRQLELFAHGETGFNRADLLARFIEAVRSLEELQQNLSAARTPEEWCDFLQKEVLERFFDCKNPEYSDELLELRKKIIAFGVAAHKAEYTYPLHIAAVTAALDFSGSVGHPNFLRGKMTFCSLVPLRAVPAKIIAVLGLNSEDFPPADSRDELNFLIKAKIHGVPSGAADSRYLLLETLMAAREKLILSYIGKAPEKEETREPAAPLGSIIQILNQGYGCTVTQFPLQSVALTDKITPAPELNAVPLESVKAEKKRTLTLYELNQILLNPSGAWWRAHWKEEMEIPEDNSADEDEPLEKTPLLNSILCNRLFDLEQQTLPEEQCKAQLLQERILPLGGIGEEIFDLAKKQLDAVPEELKKELRSENQQEKTLEFQGGNGTLLSAKGRFYKTGALKLCFSKPKTEKLLPLYLEQLLRCAAGEKCERKAVFIIKDDYRSKKQNETVYKADTTFQFPAYSVEEARKQLDDLLCLAQEAQEKVLPLFCHASSSYAQACQAGKTPGEAFEKASASFGESSDETGGSFSIDTRNAAVAALFGTWEKVEAQKEEFEKLALRLYQPLYPVTKGRASKESAQEQISTAGTILPAVPENQAVPPWQSVPLKGFAIIEAAAGTGKTHNLKNIVARMLIERPEIGIGNIVVVTFTRAAAGELRGRIRERLEALAQQDLKDEEVPVFTALSNLAPDEIRKRARKALMDFDNAPIGTIHSFAARILRDHGFGARMSFNFTVEENSAEALKFCLRDFYRKLRYSTLLPDALQKLIFPGLSIGKIQEAAAFYLANPECVPASFPALEELSVLPETQWSEKLPQFRLAVIGEAFRWCKEKMLEHNEKENVLSNDDLILELHKALREQPGLKEQLQEEYQAGLIDEFQDTDRKQFDIFRELFIDNPQGTLLVVGDPRQAIYRFRSGDIDTYFAACKLLQSKGAPVFQMNCNRRSVPELIQGFNAIFAAKPGAFAREGMTLPVQTPADSGAKGLLDSAGNFVPGALTVRCIQGNVSNAISCCAEEIARMLNSGLFLPPDKEHAGKIPLAPDHFAVLVSSWNKAHQVRRALQKFNIPAICIHGENIFSTPTAQILLELLEAVVTPESPAACCRAQSALGSVDRKLVEIPPELCCTLRDLWLKRSFISMFNALTEKLFIIERFSACSGGEKRIANWYQLGDLLYETGSRKQLTPRGTVNELRIQITKPDKDEHLNAIRETDRGAVVIDTVFGSKGLAYPIVFLPDFFSAGNALHKDRLSGKYHDDSGNICYTPDPDETVMEREKAEIQQENLRKFYVALTRARYCCRFYFGQAPGQNSPLDWLFRETVKSVSAPESNGKKKKAEAPQTKLVFPEILTAELPLNTLPEHFRLETPPVCWRRIDHETKIAQGRPFLSFSGLVQHDGGMAETKFRSDHLDEEIAALPGGTMFGLAVHRILELTAFDAPEEKLKVLSRHVMANFGFYDAQIQQEAAVMAGNVLRAPLDGSGKSFQLSEIPAEKRMAEFEFLYETDSRFSRLQTVKTAFDYFDAKFPTAERENADGVNFHFDGAFFNGFIDLFFEHEGKFYIVDWKTNFLGKRFEEYDAHGTAAAMRSNGYCLQYLIYTAALMKYLSYRKNRTLNKEFYDEFFGGIRYIFTRGVSPLHPGCGIFSDRPSWAEITPFLELIAK